MKKKLQLVSPMFDLNIEEISKCVACIGEMKGYVWVFRFYDDLTMVQTAVGQVRYVTQAMIKD